MGSHGFTSYQSQLVVRRPVSHAVLVLLLRCAHRVSAYFKSIFVREVRACASSDSLCSGAEEEDEDVESFGDSLPAEETAPEEENEDNEPAEATGSAFPLATVLTCVGAAGRCGCCDGHCGTQAQGARGQRLEGPAECAGRSNIDRLTKQRRRHRQLPKGKDAVEKVCCQSIVNLSWQFLS